MVLYEYPLNENIRTLLRLEHLFDRLNELVARETAVDHHVALVTLFEIMDVAARVDLKSDLIKELDRHQSRLQGFRGHPGIAEDALDDVLKRLEHAAQRLNQLAGKPGQALAGNEWLMSIRSRVGIPGGTCAFDLPAYFAWQQTPAERRQRDLRRWADNLAALGEALSLQLKLLRESGTPQRVLAQGGQYQQSLPQNRSHQLLRVRLDQRLELAPEITGHRLMVSVRLMAVDVEGRLKPYTGDVHFDLALCA